MRAFRIIAWVVVLAFAFVIGAFIWSLVAPSTGRRDAIAAKRIEQLCTFKTECKVRVGDLFDGDWDTLYEFGTGVSQAEIDAILGTGKVRTGDLERILVLTRRGRIVAREYEASSAETSRAGEVEFVDEHHREQHAAAYRADAWLRVTAYAADQSGSYYVLSPEEP